ncbi:MAG: NADH-quinone oxidoreductase subunit C [Bacteroidetes bacterium]|nr:MAG: NADH-quinone oxidoreductase subunit C [Bacteroidota bacterium]
MSQFLDTIQQSQIQQYIRDVRSYAGEMTIEIYPEHLLPVMNLLKDSFGFNYLVDITATDNYTDEERFEVSYNLVSIAHSQRLRVSLRVGEEHPVVETVVPLWPSAEWQEREAFDMVGIRFQNHPDLRRIYMPEDFAWHPLRKEFPLLGIPGSISLPEKDGPKEYK